jgi:hypothetical protein
MIMHYDICCSIVKVLSNIIKQLNYEQKELDQLFS